MAVKFEHLRIVLDRWSEYEVKVIVDEAETSTWYLGVNYLNPSALKTDDTWKIYVFKNTGTTVEIYNTIGNNVWNDRASLEFAPLEDVTLDTSTIPVESLVNDLVATLSSTNGYAPVEFFIITDTDSKFKIVGSELQLIEVPTYPNTYSVTIRAVDANADSIEKTFEFTVDAPIPVPTAVNLDSLTVIAEGTAGQLVGNLSTTSGVSAFTYTITSDPDSKFQISGSELQLSTTVTELLTHNVTIKTTDSNGAFFSNSFTVTVDASASTPDYAALFDGINDYGKATPYFAMYGISLGMSMWIKPSSYGSSGSSRIFRQNTLWDIEIFDTGNLVAACGWKTTTATNVINLNVWTHVFVVYEGVDTGITRIYINGIQVATSSSGGVWTSPTNNIIFARYSSSIGHFEGAQRNFVLYDKSPTPTEVLAVYDLGRSGDVSTLTTLYTDVIIWLKMNEGTGTDLIDSKGSTDFELFSGATYISDIV